MNSFLNRLFPLLTFCLLLAPLLNDIKAQENNLDYYLPSNVKYNPDIPSPKSFLGYEIGDWHIGHDQLVYYLKELANKSDRIELTEYARSHENRPLIALSISSEKNIGNLENIRKAHLNRIESKREGSDSDPVVVFLGNSVHGNESSGANSSALVAYYLAAAEGPAIDKILENSIILLDPALNPDGLNRFASWVNSHKSQKLNPDNNEREFNEVWPGGRTNHYWFDLNRDWLLVQHPESQGRINFFHKWKPNVVTDTHEMSTNSTYFFQPGIPSRNNPLTPEATFLLTEKLAKFHASALDSIGSLYYSKESFDDFYFGKGSTYPDINGSVGILFEQASSRGHLQNSTNGLLSFPFTIRNQFNTALSTMKGAVEIKADLLKHQKDFYSSALKLAKKDKVKSYAYGTKKEKGLCNEMNKILDAHKIEYKKIEDKDSEFQYHVSTNQFQYRLIKSLFEKRTKFKDSLFYDVSTWTLPLAFNVSYEINPGKIKTEKSEKSRQQNGKIIGDLNETYACLFEWHEMSSPKLLYQLLEKEIQVKVAAKSFMVLIEGKKRYFPEGSILVPVKSQIEKQSEIFSILKSFTQKNFTDIYAINTGLTPDGIDFGSPNFKKLKAPKIGLIVGEGVNQYEAGEVWFTLDKKFEIPVSKIEKKDLSDIDWDDYNVLIMVRGVYAGISQARMKSWVSNGGILITQSSASTWLAGTEFCTFNAIKNKNQKIFDNHHYHYHSIDKLHGAQNIGGVILEAEADLSHPLFYGYSRTKIPLFRNHKNFFKTPENKFAAPMNYSASPLLSGYISQKNLKQISNSPAVLIAALGSGRMISFMDNPNFRAYFMGTNKMFMNAIFFGHIIKSRSTE